MGCKSLCYGLRGQTHLLVSILVPTRAMPVHISTTHLTVVDLRLSQGTHYPCRYCRRDRYHGCKNPHHRASLAREITGSLDHVIDSLTLTHARQKTYGQTLTHQRQQKNTQAVVAKGALLLFDPSVTTRTSLDDCFHVFTDPIALSIEPACGLQNQCARCPSNY